MNRARVFLACGLLPALAGVATGQVMTVQKLLALPRPAADHRSVYGEHVQQYGELRLPAGDGPFPVVVLLHGGCWLAPYDLGHVAGLAAAFAEEGVATWSVTYRRLGDEGGGFPGTFLDVAAGFEHLRQLALNHPLDLEQVVVLGHSAGGHLALWLAGRYRIGEKSPIQSRSTLNPAGVVALAPIGDLATAAAGRVCGDAVARLLGGVPTEVPERLAAASPKELLPLGVPQRLILGELDSVVPGSLGSAWVAAAAAVGDQVAVVTVPGIGHYELVVPGSRAWPAVRAAVLDLLGLPDAGPQSVR